jgi:hypothetical protein
MVLSNQLPSQVSIMGDDKQFTPIPQPAVLSQTPDIAGSFEPSICLYCSPYLCQEGGLVTLCQALAWRLRDDLSWQLG